MLDDHLRRACGGILLSWSLWLLYFASLTLMGCMPGSTNSETSAGDVKASSIQDVITGNKDRCGDDDGALDSYANIYNDVYEKSERFFKILVDRVQKGEDGRPLVDQNKSFLLQPGLNPDARTRKTIVESVRMLLNIMGDDGTSQLPDRPIHPAAFFSVMRDFEANKHDLWSDHNYFGLTTDNCSHGLCYGLFQIDLVDLGYDRVNRLKQMCGASGLGLLGGADSEGALDFCAALQWWNGGQKCSNLRINMDHVAPNQRPVGDGNVICVPLNQVDAKKENPCNLPHSPWTTQTFAYGYYCAYVQHNQWKHFGIYDTWGRAYTGFNTTGVSPSLPNNKEVKGYEYCAVKRYLKQLKSGKKCIQGGDSYTVTSRPPPPQLVRASVADFACKIGLLPSWLSPSDCQKIDPAVPYHQPKAPAQATAAQPKDGDVQWWEWIRQPFGRSSAEEQTTPTPATPAPVQAGCENGWVEFGSSP